MAPDVQLPATRPAPWRGILGVLVALSVLVTIVSLLVLALGADPLFAEGSGPMWFMFDVSQDFNAPTWWSASLLVVAGAVYLLAGWAALPRSRAMAAAWFVLGVLTALMSLDDTIRIHERLDRITNQVLDPARFPFTWLLLGIPVALGVLVVAVVLGRALPRGPRTAVLWGYGIFFFAAIGIETLGGWVLHTTGVSTWYRLSYHVEELLEMVGSGLLVVAPLVGVRTSVDRHIWVVEG